jgi:hypothetical protein
MNAMGKNYNISISATVFNPIVTDEGDPEGVNLNNFFSLMTKSGAYICIPSRDIWPRCSVDARLPRMPVLNKNGNPKRDRNGKIIYQPASKWLDKNRPVEGMTWAPGLPLQIPNRLISMGWIERNNVSCFNLYRPPRIKLSKARLWLDLFSEIYLFQRQSPSTCTLSAKGVWSHRFRNLFAGPAGAPTPGPALPPTG